jgi:chromosome segregation ATPase
VADKTNDILNHLLSGQKRLESDVSELKTDVSELKRGQIKLESDVSELKTDVSELKRGQSKLESDFSELKRGQSKLESDFSELKEGQQRLELFLINMENRIMPIINATYEKRKMSEEQIELLQKTKSEHGDKLENHELRILRLEHSKQ